MISIKQPAEKGRSYLDGAISISDIYGPLLSALENVEKKSYRKDLEDIPKKVEQDIQFHFVDKMQDVLMLALENKKLRMAKKPRKKSKSSAIKT